MSLTRGFLRKNTFEKENTFENVLLSQELKRPRNPKFIKELKEKKITNAKEKRTKKSQTKTNPIQQVPPMDDADFQPHALARRAPGKRTPHTTIPAAAFPNFDTPALLLPNQFDETIAKLQKVHNLLQAIQKISCELATNPGVLAMLNTPIINQLSGQV